MKLANGYWSRIKRSKRFYKMLWSYVSIVILILAVLSAVIYNSIIGLLRDEINNANQAKMAHVSESVDMRIRELGKIAFEIESNHIFSYYSYMSDSYSKMQCIRELKKYGGSNTFISDMFLYYPNRVDSSVFGMNGTYGIDDLFGVVYTYTHWHQDDFLSAISAMKGMYTRPVEEVLAKNLVRNFYATIIFPVPLNSGYPKSIVMYLIDYKVLSDFLNGMLYDHRGSAYILDDNNQVIASSLGGNSTAQSQTMLEEIKIDSLSANAVVILSDSEEMIVSKYVSETTNWTFVTLIPADQVYDKVKKVNAAFIYTISLLFIFACVLSVWQANKQYRALKYVVDAINHLKIRNVTVKQNSKSEDEIEFISKSVELVSHENEDLNRRLSDSLLKSKNQLMISFLNGEIAADNEQHDLYKLLNIAYDADQIYAVMVCIDDTKDIVEMDKSDDEDDISETNITNMMQIAIESQMSDQVNGFTVSLHQGGIALILQMTQLMADLPVIYDMAERIKDYYHTGYRRLMTIGISCFYQHIGELPKAYQESARAASYRLARGSGQIICYSDVVKTECVAYQHPIELEDNLIKAVLQGGNSAIEASIDALLAEENMRMTPDIVKNVYYSMINRIIRLVSEMNFEHDNQMQAEIYGAVTATSFRTLDNVRMSLIETCTKISTLIDQFKMKNATEIVRNVINFIDEHYSDNRLSIDDLAHYASTSVSYLRKEFKDKTGDSIMHYLDIVRMKQAKNLLGTTDLKIDKILDKVGYVDKTNFIRKFRKIEGLTPMQYRNIMGRKHPEQELE